MFSKEILNIGNLKLNAYGLKEYRQLKKGTPLGVFIVLPGLKQTQYDVEKLCQGICNQNNRRDTSDIFIMTISMDHPFHGTRQVPSVNINLPDPSSYHNQMYMLDRGMDLHSVSGFIIGLIDAFEPYVFGYETEVRVHKWGIAGFSMGGYLGLYTACIDPRLSTVVVLSCGLSLSSLVHGTLQGYDLDVDYYFPSIFREKLNARLRNQADRLKNTNILLLNGGEDKMYPASANYSFLDELRRTHNGIEGYHWKSVVVPQNGHYISSTYIKHSVEWINQWMFERISVSDSRL